MDPCSAMHKYDEHIYLILEIVSAYLSDFFAENNVLHLTFSVTLDLAVFEDALASQVMTMLWSYRVRSVVNTCFVVFPLYMSADTLIAFFTLISSVPLYQVRVASGFETYDVQLNVRVVFSVKSLYPLNSTESGPSVKSVIIHTFLYSLTKT